MNVSEIQKALTQAELDAWLLFDFHGINPIASRVAGLAAGHMITRRWFGLLPVQGDPVWLHSAIEGQAFAELPGTKISYVGWRQLEEKLRELVGGRKRIAMEYSPGGAIPYVSRVDAGTFEMVRACGVEVVTSADLVQFFEARWSPGALASHRRAARHLDEIVVRTFGEVARIVGGGRTPTEYEIQQFMTEAFRERDLVTEPPIVAVNANAGNPHYEPSAQHSAAIRSGDLLLLDLWCREKGSEAVYADITWMGFVGKSVPGRYDDVWQAVAGARDAAIRHVLEGSKEGGLLRGCDVDDVARAFIRDRGYERFFIHRTGHNVGREVHGNGAHLDNLETRDERRLIPGTGFTIEPGIYLPEYGIRSEVNLYISGNGAEVTTSVQDRITPILSS
ncbi:MAG TPA: M24 family metallopeptidase [Candidatus Polarisedimenticolia bacterium]|jgi:Xaa-Pro aminopeptidase|nr:M24 family metallopeptidase [Candidatus Polarisedimenticolia bacterium]